MRTVVGEDIAEVFTKAVALTLAGERVCPRGLPTREVTNVHLVLKRPRSRLLHAPPARILNPAFAVAETVWILSGSDEAWIFDFNGQLRQYADDGVLLGAYGPRLRRWNGQVDQLARVLATLRADPESRRAVVQLYDPGRDAAGHRDVPCTLGFRLHLRGGRLHMVTTMRSQDLWTGLPYDLVFTTVLHELMAGWLGAELGDYHHQIDSLHLYEEVLERAAEVRDTAMCLPMPELVTPWEGFDALLALVRDGEPVEHPGWSEMAAVLACYRLWKSGQRVAARQQAERLPGGLGQGLRAWYGELQRRAVAR